METKLDGRSTTEAIKLLAAVLMTASGLVGFYYFNDIPNLYRVIALIVSVGISLTLYIATSNGQNTLNFLKSAQSEIKKVVWPTRQETTQTTLIVLVVVIIFGIILWLLDLVLSSLVSIVI